MNETSFVLNAMLLASGLFIGMVVMHELGRRIGLRQVQQGDGNLQADSGVVDGAIFALLGLMIAFTFSGAATRFEERRKLVIEEANAISSAYVRLDLLPPSARADIQQDFRRYIDTRLAAYRAMPDLTAAKAELARAADIYQVIWTKSVAASAGSQAATIVLLPELNDMSDLATKRTTAASTHTPTVIFVLLCGLGLLSGALVGYSGVNTRRHGWFHIFAFALAFAGTVYVILDLEYPRAGLVRLDAYDQTLVDVRQGMK